MILLLIEVLFLPWAAAQGQRCQWSSLRNTADLFREGLSFGELDASFTFAPNHTYVENGKPGSAKTGIFTRPLKIDYDQTLIDQETCAIYTSLLSLSPPSLVGAQIFFSPLAGGGTSALEATAVDIVALSATGDKKGFDAAKTLEIVGQEDWDSISQPDRTDRGTLGRIADAYLDLVGGGNQTSNQTSATVPFAQPCWRLDGDLDALDTCMPWSGSGPVRRRTDGREYVVDDTVGGVSVFSTSAAGVRDSWLFRVEGGRLRYVHHVAAKL